MKNNEVAIALSRAQAVYARRPAAAVHDDSPALARWQQGLRVVTTHPSGRSVASDMPTEFGGSGAEVTPGWYARAGTAACAATCIAIAAELQGICLTRLEVSVHSRSDSRGLLGMSEPDGQAVDSAPTGFAINVTIAGGADAPMLESLVRQGCRCSPIGLCVQRANALALNIEVAD